jgi:hypothetical protein
MIPGIPGDGIGPFEKGQGYPGSTGFGIDRSQVHKHLADPDRIGRGEGEIKKQGLLKKKGGGSEVLIQVCDAAKIIVALRSDQGIASPGLQCFFVTFRSQPVVPVQKEFIPRIKQRILCLLLRPAWNG